MSSQASMRVGSCHAEMDQMTSMSSMLQRRRRFILKLMPKLTSTSSRTMDAEVGIELSAGAGARRGREHARLNRFDSGSTRPDGRGDNGLSSMAWEMPAQARKDTRQRRLQGICETQY